MHCASAMPQAHHAQFELALLHVAGSLPSRYAWRAKRNARGRIRLPTWAARKKGAASMLPFSLSVAADPSRHLSAA